MRKGIFIVICICLISILFHARDYQRPRNSENLRNSHLQILDSIKDGRDGMWYDVLRVDSLYWFNENLAYSTSGSEVLTNGMSSVRVYSFEQSKIVCPEGWRLPTVEEFDHLISVIADTVFSGIITLNYDWQNVSENSLGYRFDQTGFLHKRKLESAESFNIWLDDPDLENAYHVHLCDTNPRDQKENLTVFRHTHEKHLPKKHRKFPVRCVCEVAVID